MKKMIYAKLDETTKTMDKKMEKLNDETKGEIKELRSEMKDQFAEIKFLISQVTKSEWEMRELQICAVQNWHKNTK